MLRTSVSQSRHLLFRTVSPRTRAQWLSVADAGMSRPPMGQKVRTFPPIPTLFLDLG